LAQSLDCVEENHGGDCFREQSGLPYGSLEGGEGDRKIEKKRERECL
jgi:hypothetical protein